MMALTAAKATRPASVSLGLCSRIRIARLRSVSTSATAALAPRRRGASSSLADFLGTFLHQSRLVLNIMARRRHQRRDLAFALPVLRRRADKWQLDGDGRPLAELALYRQLAEMQGDEALHDRQSETGAFMATLIGPAGLEERRANPFQVVGRDTDAGVADA